jgi:hypothetical protein
MKCFVCTECVNYYNSILFPDVLSDAVYHVCFACMDSYLSIAHQSVHRHVMGRAITIKK